MSEPDWEMLYNNLAYDCNELKRLAENERVRFQEALLQLTSEYTANKSILEAALSEKAEKDKEFMREHTLRQTEAMEGILKELHRIENRMA